MNIIFFDDKEWTGLHPLTLNKPVSELRMGILTFRERWERLIDGQFSYLTEEYLSERFPLKIEEHNLFLNPSYFPDESFLSSILKLKQGESLWVNENLIAANCSLEDFKNRDFSENLFKKKRKMQFCI